MGEVSKFMQGSTQGRPLILQVKRGRNDAALGDFVCSESSKPGADDVVSKLQAVGLEPARRRVFRHVATCTADEARRLLEAPNVMEALGRARLDVKQQNKANVERMAQRDRGAQEQGVKARRLRVLQEKRLDHANVLEAESGQLFKGSKRRRSLESPATASASAKGQEQNVLMCNGTPMKRVNVSLAAQDDDVVDLFVEDETADSAMMSGESMYEVQLERFWMDDEEEAVEQFDDVYFDPEEQEIDYPSSSSSSEHSASEEYWYRPGYDSENEYENDRYEAYDCYDGTVGLDEDLERDPSMPWNQI